MNLENRIEVGSVSEFLEAVKQIYCDQDYQLFYRGVSKKQYATPEHDHPGIYRNKNWIENEDKMFYELTAKCPEYFKDCKTTFEHLVMMQHYGYPTRLLDITSNPLVALYFACGGLNGSNSESGQLISYHIKKNDIRNYEDTNIALLSNLSKSHQELTYSFFVLNRLIVDMTYNYKVASSRIDMEKNIEKPLVIDFYSKLMKHKKYIDQVLEISFLDKEQEKGKNLLRALYVNICSNAVDRLPESKLYFSMQKILSFVDQLAIWIINNRKYSPFIQYVDKVQYEIPSFLSRDLLPDDMLKIQCVLPKQNNPRLIAQQGAFLLFGFKDAVSNKTAIPIIPDEMYGKFETCFKDGNGQVIEKQQSSQKAEIIIKGSEKQKILDELKILGISNSTMFPEIDNIANELKSQYAKLR